MFDRSYVYWTQRPRDHLGVHAHAHTYNIIYLVIPAINKGHRQELKTKNIKELLIRDLFILYWRLKNSWIDEGNELAPCNQRRCINELPFTSSYFIVGHHDFCLAFSDAYISKSMKLSVCRVPLADHKMHRQSVTIPLIHFQRICVSTCTCEILYFINLYSCKNIDCFWRATIKSFVNQKHNF